MLTEDEINPMENVTASELAGFAVGALLVCATISAPRIDAFISSSQRRSVLFFPFSLFNADLHDFIFWVLLQFPKFTQILVGSV